MAAGAALNSVNSTCQNVNSRLHFLVSSWLNAHRAEGLTIPQAHHPSLPDAAPPAPPQLIGRLLFFSPSCCSMYGSPFVIQSGAGSPFR